MICYSISNFNSINIINIVLQKTAFLIEIITPTVQLFCLIISLNSKNISS